MLLHQVAPHQLPLHLPLQLLQLVKRQTNLLTSLKLPLRLELVAEVVVAEQVPVRLDQELLLLVLLVQVPGLRVSAIWTG